MPRDTEAKAADRAAALRRHAHQYAQACAREVGVSEGRIRAWVSYMIMAGVLERVADGAIPGSW